MILTFQSMSSFYSLIVDLSPAVSHSFLPFQNACGKNSRCQNNAIVSLVSHSRDIDACALLDSREKIVKKVRFKRCQKKQNIALNLLNFKDIWSSSEYLTPGLAFDDWWQRNIVALGD